MESDAVSISTTSLSGMENLMNDGAHAGSVASTMRLTFGGGGRLAFIPLVGWDCTPLVSNGISVVRFPESANAAKILVPLEFTVIARGCSPKTGMFVTMIWMEVSIT